MADNFDVYGGETPATVISPGRAPRRWLVIIPLLLLGGVLWVAHWFEERSALFAGAEVAFGPPRWKWLEPVLRGAASEYCGNPVRLSITKRRLTPRQLKMVGSYDSLETLALTGLTDDDLIHLSGLSNLHGLSLLDSQISAAGCEHLRGLQKLRVLWIGSPHLDDHCLAHFARLNELQQLRLNGGSFTEKGFEPLTRLPMLSGMTILNGRLSGDPLRPIAERSSVRHLDIHNTNLTDEMLAPFEQSGILQNMTLHKTQVTREACLRLINALPHLSLSTDYEQPPRDLPTAR